MAEERTAKVKILLDVNNSLTQIDRLQKKLDSLSIKNITVKDADKVFNGITGNADRAKKSIDGLRTEYVNAVNDMNKAMKKNKLSFTFASSDEYKKLYQNIKNTRQTLEHLANAFKTVADSQKNLVSKDTLNRLEKLNKQLSKANDKTAKLADKFKGFDTGHFNSTIEQLTLAIQNLNMNTLTQQIKGLNTALTRVNNNLNNQGSQNNNNGAGSPPNNGRPQGTGWLTTYWASEQDDLMKYFFVRLKSGVAKSLGTYVENYITNAIPNTFNSLVNYEQNRVNFAQVMPEEVGNNQKLMNSAMREFMNIASDYGTSVQEVTEAGRLWGRQYKDVATVQALVRNSTKLSITDNMSLTEVNKALEATMQQYNVQLRDANEAQVVSGRIVDVWAKLADNAVVTAQDLARASEQAGGSAYQAGVSFDYLQAMIATMSTATGKSGAEVGRAIRSMLVSMNSAKAQKFFTQLGIATKELDENGTMRVRSFEKVITDLMLKLKTYPKDASNAILAMSGGRRILALSYGNI